MRSEAEHTWQVVTPVEKNDNSRGTKHVAHVRVSAEHNVDVMYQDKTRR